MRIVRGVTTRAMPTGKLRGDGSLPLPVRMGVPLNEYLEDLTLWRSLGLIKYEGAVVRGVREVALHHAKAALAEVLTAEGGTVTAAMRAHLADTVEAAVRGTSADLLEVMTQASQQTIQHQAHVAGEMEDVWQQYQAKLQGLPPWRVPPVAGFDLATRAKDPSWMLRGLWDEELAGSVAQIRSQVLGGYLSGQSVQGLARDLRGTFGTQAADWATVSRTALHRVAARYDRELHRQNEDVLKGVKFTATLDTRTCPICGNEDGTVYEVGEGPRLPLHPNCRCKYAPVTKSVRELLGLPSAPVPPGEEGVRRSMDGVVPKSMTWDEWLAKKEAQVPGFARGVLGASRYSAWKRGSITLGDLTARGKVRGLASLGLR